MSFLTLSNANHEYRAGLLRKNRDLHTRQIELGVVIALIVVIAVAIILKWNRLGRNSYAVAETVTVR